MLTPFDDNGAIDWVAYDALIEWYLRAGASGLFASCLSSEFFHISAQERLALAERAVKRVDGRVPVIAAGPLGPDVAAMAQTARQLADVGVDAVVCLSNQFCAEALSEPNAQSQWQTNMQQWLELLPQDIPLGIYECPKPTVCNIPPQLLGWLAHTGRFFMTKDTVCDREIIGEKLANIAGTSLYFYNADAVTLLDSLRMGGAGYSGIAGNYFGHLFSWLCAHHASHPDQAAELSAFFEHTNKLVHRKYMVSAKYYLASHGLKMGLHTRAVSVELDREDADALADLGRQVARWEQSLGIVSPFAD